MVSVRRKEQGFGLASLNNFGGLWSIGTIPGSPAHGLGGRTGEYKGL